MPSPDGCSQKREQDSRRLLHPSPLHDIVVGIVGDRYGLGGCPRTASNRPEGEPPGRSTAFRRVGEAAADGIVVPVPGEPHDPLEEEVQPDERGANLGDHGTHWMM